MSLRPDTPDEARERVCQKAFDCLTNGHAFEVCDSQDTTIFCGGPTRDRDEQVALWRAAQERVAAWPDALMIEAYVDILPGH